MTRQVTEGRSSERARTGRGTEDWLLLLLSAEKAVQHAFVTWAFATDRFGLREQVTPPYEFLLVIGCASAVSFLIAIPGIWHRRPWAPRLLLILALVEIVGEFIAQGTMMIHIVLSFIVALGVLALAWRARGRYQAH